MENYFRVEGSGDEVWPEDCVDLTICPAGLTLERTTLRKKLEEEAATSERI
jgi:hypothetical protein